RAVFHKKVSRGQLLSFLSAQPRAVVAMEACATAHDRGRAIAELGHEVRLIPPVYVKPFVGRQNNDAADAEAIAEAASRPWMRFVALKSEGQQAQAMWPMRGSMTDPHSGFLTTDTIVDTCATVLGGVDGSTVFPTT